MAHRSRPPSRSGSQRPGSDPSKFGTFDSPVAYVTVILSSARTVEPSFGEMLITSPGLVSGLRLGGTAIDVAEVGVVQRLLHLVDILADQAVGDGSGLRAFVQGDGDGAVLIHLRAADGFCAVIVPLVSSSPFSCLTSTSRLSAP